MNEMIEGQLVTTTQELLDDMYGYYKCKCGHYAVEHFMDAPEEFQSCLKCVCKRFELARRKPNV